MLYSPMARRGMVTSPHHLASQAGLAVLREGGTAIEAAIAAAATLGVVYPHMTGLGGDAFWLIAEPGKPPVSIDGSGAAGAKADIDLYRRAGHKAVPARGPLAANTVAGAVSSWQLALDVSGHWGGRLPLRRLFEDAVFAAREGFAVSRSQVAATERGLAGLRRLPGFADAFLAKRKVPAAGSMLRLPALATTLERLANAGLDEFTYTTSNAIEVVGKARKGKALAIINPADPPMMMRNTISCLTDDEPDQDRITASVLAMIKEVQKYVPGYRLVNGPLFDGKRVTVFMEVAGLGDYLPKYAGNLDIMTAAATRTAEMFAEEILAGTIQLKPVEVTA